MNICPFECTRSFGGVCCLDEVEFELIQINKMGLREIAFEDHIPTPKYQLICKSFEMSRKLLDEHLARIDRIKSTTRWS